MRERERESKRLRRFVITVFLILSLILQNFLFLVNPVYAASSPWTQTDWSGGSGQTSWSDNTKFDSSSSIDTSTTVGQAILTNSEKFTNTGFETDLSSWTSSQTYDLQDQFTTELAAGNVNGTSSEPSGHTRTVTDAASKLSITGGQLSLAGGKASPAFGDPGIWYPAVARTAGKSVLFTVSETTNGLELFGFDTDQSALPGANAIYFGYSPSARTIQLWNNGGGGGAGEAMAIGSYAASTSYQLSVVLRASGAFYFIKGGAFTNWTLLWVSSSNSTATLYPVVSNYSAVSTTDNIAIPSTLYLPVPLVSDGFSGSTTDGSGHAEANGGSGLSWVDTAGTWQSSGGVASATALSGGLAIRTVSSSSSNVLLEAALTRSAGNVGIIARYSDSNNYLIAYHDGTNMHLDKVVDGVTTSLVNSAIAYSAGTVAKLILADTSALLYYGNAKVGSTVTVPSSSTTTHGLYTSNTGNTIDNFVVWPRNGYTDAPFEELTATRDTGTKYSGSASSKLVAGGTNANFTQSVNVGNTNNYNLSTYAYTNGSAVTSSDIELYYNGSTISTTYTCVDSDCSSGSHWYRLSGTLTGADASRQYGVQVKGSKTVYVDNMSLNNYATSGTLTSSIFDTEISSGAAWGTLTYSSSGSTTAVKVRTSNSSSMTGATAFSSCTAISSGSDISSNSCVIDGHRYVQYQLSLSTSNTSTSPTFSDITITFATYDADAPSTSLTALSPDPNSDNTPTLSGTATESTGTVSNVQFQMDSTSGSWSSCSADDGSFDEATETFTCTSSALSDGSHTIYVRATDSNSNTTASGNYASDTFTIDATTPISIDLDNPGDNSYTNSERPTFKWKATTDATAGLSKYVLEIDNPSIGNSQPSGDFTVDNIPTSRTTDYETNKYTIHYENFSDSDSTNNYISAYTKSYGDWGNSENDGKLREGRVSWKVKAVDNAGNESSSSRTLFVDRSSPKVELTQINNIPFSSSYFSTTDKTPTIFGKITDSLSGGDSSQAQDENGPKIASAPKEVNIKIEKKTGLTYNLVTLYKINMDKPWYTCDGKEISDNSKQKCDKYLPFEYTSKENLELGTYKITLTGKDKADNSSSETTLILNITTLAQINTSEEKKIIEEEIKPLKPEEQEITKPIESPQPNIIEKTGQQITHTSKNILSYAGNFITGIFKGIGSGFSFVGNAIGNGYNSIADNAPGFTKNVLLAIVNIANSVINGTKNGIANLAFVVGEKTEDVSHGLGTAIIKIGYLFVPEPTKIHDVQVLVLSPTSARISWKTNHPANGKVNYGLDETYPLDVQSEKRVTNHEFTLSNLKPDTEYHFEVMSQNRNYVYDANRKFITPKE